MKSENFIQKQTPATTSREPPGSELESQREQSEPENCNNVAWETNVKAHLHGVISCDKSNVCAIYCTTIYRVLHVYLLILNSDQIKMRQCISILMVPLDSLNIFNNVVESIILSLYYQLPFF